jgi:Ala-tRNA(Pro) deacylase
MELKMEQKEKVYETLDRLGIRYQVMEHPAVYTINEMEALEIFLDNPWIVKNLFLRDGSGKRHFLVTLDMNKRVDLKELRKQLGTSGLSFASEERLMKYLGLTKGSVTPLGILNDSELAVEVVFDSSLVGRDKIGVHPNDNTATVMLRYEDLEKVIKQHGNHIHVIDI